MTTTRPGRTSPPSTVSRPRAERTPPDRSWRRLYRAGAWAAAVYVVMVLTPMVLLATAPIPPSSGAAVLEYIDSHGMVYLVELVCFVGLSVPALVVFTASAIALKHVDKSTALIGTGAATSITVTQATHGLAAAQANLVQLQEAATGLVVQADVTVASSGDVTVVFTVAPASNAIRITILG